MYRHIVKSSSLCDFSGSVLPKSTHAPIARNPRAHPPFLMYLRKHSRLTRGLCVARALFARGSRLYVAMFQRFFIVSVHSVALPPLRSARALLPSRAKCLSSWVLWADRLPLSKTGVFSLTNSP